MLSDAEREDVLRRRRLLDEARAEIARLRAQPEAILLPQEPLGKEFERVLYENLNDLYVRSDAPPEADVMERVTQAYKTVLDTMDQEGSFGGLPFWSIINAYTIALTEYGDQRALAERERILALLRESAIATKLGEP